MKRKLNLTIDPDIRAAAEAMANRRRRSLSQLFEDLIEAEWDRNPPLPSSMSKAKLTYKKRRPGRTP
jgi:hypothetical protein